MDDKFKSNLEICENDGCVLISVDPKIYPLDVIYSAAYVFLDKTYVLIRGNPKKEIIVELKPKEEYDLIIARDIKLKPKEKHSMGVILEQFGREFNNELLNYITYSKLTKKMKI